MSFLNHTNIFYTSDSNRSRTKTFKTKFLDKAVVKAFFRKVFKYNGRPDKVVQYLTLWVGFNQLLSTINTSLLPVLALNWHLRKKGMKAVIRPPNHSLSVKLELVRKLSNRSKYPTKK